MGMRSLGQRALWPRHRGDERNLVSATSLTSVTAAHSLGAANVVATNPDTQTSGGSGNGLHTYN